MKVRLEPEDVLDGTPGESRDCAVAIAIERAIGVPVSVSTTIGVEGQTDEWITTPKDVTEATYQFDTVGVCRGTELEIPGLEGLVA